MVLAGRLCSHFVKHCEQAVSSGVLTGGVGRERGPLSLLQGPSDDDDGSLSDDGRI